MESNDEMPQWSDVYPQDRDARSGGRFDGYFADSPLPTLPQAALDAAIGRTLLDFIRALPIGGWR